MEAVIKSNDIIPVGFPVLLRTARKTYSWAIKGALNNVGITSIPRNGVYVLVSIYKYDAGIGQLIRELGISKQAASQLVDDLVEGGFVSRATSTIDRRRYELSLTEKGSFAAEVIQEAITAVNDELKNEVGEANEQIAKYVLAVLIDINDRKHGLPRGIR